MFVIMSLISNILKYVINKEVMNWMHVPYCKPLSLMFYDKHCQIKPFQYYSVSFLDCFICRGICMKFDMV
jgi:hypothetical protein